MSIDRILQLKLVADVSDINAKMGSVEKSTGRIGAAFGKLKSFAVPILANFALEGVTAVTDMFHQAVEDARALDDALFGLNETGKSLDLDAPKLRRTADAMRDLGVSLGVPDDVGIVESLNRFLTATGKLPLATNLVGAVFDAMRVKGIGFKEADELIWGGIVQGRRRAMDELGITGDNAVERFKSFDRKYGQAAEEFVTTQEGQWQRAEAEFAGHMLNLGILVDMGLGRVKAGLVTAWDNLGAIVGGLELIFAGLSAKWGPAIDDAAGFVGDLGTTLEPVLGLVRTLLVGPLELAQDLLGLVWKAITGDAQGALDDVVELVRRGANAIIDLLNQLSRAFAFDASWDIPSFDVPDPTQLLEGGTIKIGGGTVNLSRGPLFDDIPHLAQGAIVRRPTLAMIGEGRHDEAVVPLDGRAMGNTYQITVQAGVASPADVGRAVVEAIEAYERRAGAHWRGG